MAAISRRSLVVPISIMGTAATADDLDGTSDGTQWFDVTDAKRVIWVQSNEGTAGTAGIDCIEVSHDGGSQWYADTTVIPAANNDTTGDIAAAGALNAAGVEPATPAFRVFKSGPYEGPTLVRVGRDTSNRGVNGTGTDWVSGAPAVYIIGIGDPAGGGALSTYA